MIGKLNLVVLGLFATASMALAQLDVKRRWHFYEQMAAMTGGEGGEGAAKEQAESQ